MLLTASLTASVPAWGGEIVVDGSCSIADALRQAREWRRTGDKRCEGGITITIKAGRYYMQEPLLIRPEDSGTKESPLTIRGEQGTVVCGDPRQQHTQLWPEEGMARMLDFDTATRTITIPKPPSPTFSLLSSLLSPPTAHLSSLEMVVHQRWAIAILRVKAFSVHGDSVAVTFMEPESRLEFEHPWPQPVINGEKGSSSFMLRTTELRYGIEQLVVLDGANYVTVEGITFEHSCWNRPLHKGHVALQGGFPIVDAYKLKDKPGLPWDENLENQAWVERPVSAVTVRNASHVNFTTCRFQHLGATALDYESTKWSTVEGCTFEDIGGTAILAGSFAEWPREVHCPYSDLAGQCSALVIKGNTIHDAANEDWGAVGIGCGYANFVIIANNTVSHVNYSGICVGWGWTPKYTGMENNHIINNKVSDYARQLYDAGGIYTLSNQPQSTISDNQIAQPYPAPYATNDRAFCIYLDARTDGFTISNNTTEGRLIRRKETGVNNPGKELIFKQ